MLRSLNDKKEETALIESIGIAVPKTVQALPSEPAVLARQLEFPIIFKPRSFAVKHIFQKKNATVANPDELERFYSEHENAIAELLAQEVIPGPDELSWVTSCTFDSDHRLLDCGIKQKIRMKPPHFGGSTFAISADNDDVRELTRRVGTALGYVGHAGIEFRWDERSDSYLYIECNPRMPENVEFDEFCNVQTVWNSYLVAQGLTVENPAPGQKTGVVYLDLYGDVRGRMQDGESIFAIVASYLRHLRHARKGPYFALDDPRPGLVVAGRALGFYTSALTRRLRRMLGRRGK